MSDEITKFDEKNAGKLYKFCKWFLALMCVCVILLSVRMIGIYLYHGKYKSIFIILCYTVPYIALYTYLSNKLYDFIEGSFIKRNIIKLYSLILPLFCWLSWMGLNAGFGMLSKYQSYVFAPFFSLYWFIMNLVFSLRMMRLLFNEKLFNINAKLKKSKLFIIFMFFLMISIPMILTIIFDTSIFLLGSFDV